MFPNPAIVAERLRETFEVCLLREGELSEGHYGPWIAEDFIRGFILDRPEDINIGETVGCFHKVGQEWRAFRSIFVEVEHVGFGVVGRQVTNNVDPGSILTAGERYQNDWIS